MHAHKDTHTVMHTDSHNSNIKNMRVYMCARVHMYVLRLNIHIHIYIM